MDTYTLFDTTDLSLFGGDLEVVSEFASKDHGNLSTYVELEDIRPLELDLHSNEVDVPSQLLSPSLPSHGVKEAFELPNWLDSKVDLLDLLGLPVVEEKGLAEDDTVAATPKVMLEESGNVVDKCSSLTQGATGLHLLQSMAEEMVSMITPNTDDPPQKKIVEGADLDIMELLSSGGADSLDMDVVSNMDLMPALSPVTPEDIENVLSSGCSSPASSEHGNSSFEDDGSVPVYSSGNSVVGLLTLPLEDLTSDDTTELKIESKSSRSSRRTAPYNKKSRDQERKLRKKQQNKDAATRYRQKKRAECEAVDDELSALESRNKSLHDTVDQMTREIQYLKDLLNEVYKAKGMLK